MTALPESTPHCDTHHKHQQKGQLIVISGPSGVGKGTICRQLIEKQDGQLVWSVSATSRHPRPAEVDGKDYHFFSLDDFKQGIDQGHFLEWAEYNGQYYGTPRQAIDEQRNMGKSVLLEIDVQGALQVKKAEPSAILIFIAPPHMTVLRERLMTRGTNTEDDMASRLAISEKEMTQQHYFDYVVVNEVLDECLQRLHALLSF